MKRILLVAPHELFRESFARALGSSLQVEIVQASSFKRGHALISDLMAGHEEAEGFDVALVDTELSDRDGKALIRKMSHAVPRIPVLILSTSLDLSRSGLSWQARLAGADGLLSKMASLDEAATAVSRLVAG